MQDEALAQEVTAVTFEKALHHIHQYEPRGVSFLAWLYRIARNEAISLHRKRKWLLPWRIIGQTEKRATETAVQRQQEFHQLHQALTRLSAKDREIIQLRYFEELTSEEVAAVLDCSVDNVYVRLHRALKKLASQLQTMELIREVSYEQ
jgi:RNA polymerase sigma-70 factor, ECF subfamily